LNDSLRYFETLQRTDFRWVKERRDRRSKIEAYPQEFVMSFSAFNRFAKTF